MVAGKRKDRASESAAGDRGDGEEIQKPKLLPSLIRNKEKRSKVYANLKRDKRSEKRKQAKAREAAENRALELGEEPPPKKIPRTIENTREPDETVCKPNDEELVASNDADEFSKILKLEIPPKILITTCRFNSTRGPAFIQELMTVIPNAHYYKRGTHELKKIVEYAKNKEFTSIVVVHTNRREPDALLIVNLPDGPTAHFKLSNLVLRKDIKVFKRYDRTFLAGFRNTSSQISASLTTNGKYIICASEDSHVYIWRHETDSKPNRNKVKINATQSYEHFHCRNVTAAIPWINPSSTYNSTPGETTPTGFNNPKLSLQLFSEPNGDEPIDSPMGSNTNHFSDRASATWPEEKLLLSSKQSSPESFTESCNGGIHLQNKSAWGLVIVTATRGGQIKTFQNFGFPVRV